MGVSGVLVLLCAPVVDGISGDGVGLGGACGGVVGDACEEEVAPEGGFFGLGGVLGGVVAFFAGAAPCVEIEAVVVEGDRVGVDGALGGVGAVAVVDGEGLFVGEGG